jgi:hypothetical protein
MKFYFVFYNYYKFRVAQLKYASFLATGTGELEHVPEVTSSLVRTLQRVALATPNLTTFHLSIILHEKIKFVFASFD